MFDFFFSFDNFLFNFNLFLFFIFFFGFFFTRKFQSCSPFLNFHPLWSLIPEDIFNEYWLQLFHLFKRKVIDFGNSKSSFSLLVLKRHSIDLSFLVVKDLVVNRIILLHILHFIKTCIWKFNVMLFLKGIPDETKWHIVEVTDSLPQSWFWLMHKFFQSFIEKGHSLDAKLMLVQL